MAVTLCVPPRAGELCAPVRFLLRDDSTVVELTSRHRITEIGWDASQNAVAVVVEIADPQTSRPVDVRFDVTAAGAEGPSRSRHLGSLSRNGTTADVDGITSEQTASLTYDLRLGPVWQGSTFGIGMVTEAVMAIEYGLAEVVVLVAAQAEAYRDHAATAPWTRPENEFVAPWGMFTAAEFALIARRHMEVYGTTREQLSLVAATIRNNGSANPSAVYAGRGSFGPDDITASRMIADPFHLLDCATTSEGGCALVNSVILKTWLDDGTEPELAIDSLDRRGSYAAPVTLAISASSLASQTGLFLSI